MTELDTGRFESVDFFTDTSIVDDPYPYYRYLREVRGPVWIEPNWGVAIVTGLPEAMVVYRDAELFSSCNAPTGPFPGLPVKPEGDDASALIEEHRSQMPLFGYMATWDPPEHAAYRSLLTGLFTAKRLRENEEFMLRLATQEIAKFLPSGECEFIREYSEPFALLVIADLLGVPESDLGRFRQWFRAQKGLGDLSEEAIQQRLNDSQEMNIFGFFESTFTDYIEDRRRQSRNDVLTHLATVTFPDGTTPDTTILANEAAFLFAAGQETTARTLAFALLYLGEDSQLQATLRADSRLIPAFTEEILRLESPVKDHFRMARRTTTLGGVQIPAGTTVMLMIGAINRDPRKYEHADEIRLDRPNQHEHVAFSKGIHACLGQQLARTEIRVSLEQVFNSMADIRISEAHHGPIGNRRYDYDPTNLFRGIKSLHLEFTPVAH